MLSRPSKRSTGFDPAAAVPRVVISAMIVAALHILLHASIVAAQAPPTAASIPFPGAIDSAAIAETHLGHIGREGLVLGNGDLNALLHSQNGALRLRVTKNDLWDARIDTSEDPALLTMDIRNRTWAGGAHSPPSYQKHPYPQPRCAAVVLVGNASGSEKPGWTCVRTTASNGWINKDGVGVMTVQGQAGCSAGYRYAFDSTVAAAFTAIKLRLCGSANARYFVCALDMAGKDLVRSGWVDAPAVETEVKLPLPAGRPAGAIELYVLSRDGKPAENRFALIAMEGAPRPMVIAPGMAEDTVASARLDLRDAAAEVKDAAGAIATVRILADRNVLLIDSTKDVSIEEVHAAQLPPAKTGETDNVKWLHMKMPGDVDYPGMEYALAVAAHGNRKAVSMVTSFDTPGNVLDAAIGLARETANADLPALLAKHRKIWDEFWSASGVELGDRFFQDAWYRNLYYMRCFCRAGTTMPITLYAGLATDSPGWHGAPTLDYNIEQVFWPMFVCNHVDLMEPYVRYIAGFAPRGRWLAKKTYGVEGLFLPVNIFGPEYLVAPDNAKSRNARQIAYIPWTYGLGLTGWGMQNLWLRYAYQPDKAYLESIYPLLRDAAEFYCNVLHQCRDDANGHAEVGPSYNPEHGPFGAMNTPVDIAYMRFLLDAAVEAAKALDRDAALASRWARHRMRIPDYETTAHGGGTIVANWKGATAESVKVHNVASPTVPIFPAGQITWFSPADEKSLFERTLRWIKHNDNNSHVMVNVARARLSFPDAFTQTRAHFSAIQTPNGLFAAWPGHGYYLAESWAFAGLTAELLVQSDAAPLTGPAQGVIRVFPAWPADVDARFVNLRAIGGFLVTAERKAGKIIRMEIKSTAGGELKLLSPWPAIEADGKPLKPDDRGIVTVDTRPGDCIVFRSR